MTLTKNELFEGIRLIRPLLILCICIAHVPGIRGYHSDYDQYDQLSTLFSVYLKDFLARGGVPILTVISGYLAYSSYQKVPYFRLLIKKVKSLLVPFLVWNVIALAFCMVAFKLWGVNFLGFGRLDGFGSYINAILGIGLQMPINLPVYFIRDLFLIMLFIPLIDVICKRKMVFIVFSIIWLVYSWMSHSILLISDAFSTHILYRTDMLLFFLLGYFYASQAFQIPKLSRYSIVAISILMAVIGLFVSMYLSGVSPSNYDYVNLRLLFSLAFVACFPVFINALILFSDSMGGRILKFISPYSFTLFLSHIVVLNVFSIIIFKLMGWHISERATPFIQMFYIALYLFFICASAIFILMVWKKVLAHLGKQRESIF